MLGVSNMERDYQRRREIQKMHGQVVDFYREVPLVTDTQKSAEISGARGK